jgi:transposase
MQTVIGLDIAKRIFQLHSVDPATGELQRVKLLRSELLEHFGTIQPAVVAMEACSSSQHWARRFAAMGHEVRLIATKFVRPFVKTNKTDAADAAAIWEAAQRPGMRFVPVKSEQQQGILALHNMRDLLVKSRTAQIHQIRAVFYEYGIDLPRGRHWGLKAMPMAFARAEGRLEGMVLQALRTQLELIHEMTRRIEALEQQLEAYERNDERCRRLRAIPGVGPLTATAIVASVGDAREFRSGREFAAWLGVVPRQSGTGGRVRLLSISKRGNPYLRAMIIHCARAVAARQRVQPPWLVKLLQTKHWNVAVVAQANKIARVIWALLAHGRKYQADWATAQ